MTASNRLLTVTLAGALAAGTLLAQGQQTPPPAAGRGPAGRGGGRSAGAVNFPQQTRPLASAEVLARGKGVYGVNCAACHGIDLRGGDQGGPSLLRSLLALSDQRGELIAPVVRGSRQDKGMPAFNFNDADTTAISEYIHSVLAMVGAQARPPGSANPAMLDVLVGNATAGQVYFQAKCTGCHSLTGDLKGIAAKYSDPRTLQNTWVSGGGRGGRGGGPPRPMPVTVTMSDGQKLQGTLIRKDDFIVTLTLADGTRKSISRNGDVPKVEIRDPDDAHKKLMPVLDDKDMHDVTAYLATVK